MSEYRLGVGLAPNLEVGVHVAPRCDRLLAVGDACLVVSLLEPDRSPVRQHRHVGCIRFVRLPSQTQRVSEKIERATAPPQPKGLSGLPLSKWQYPARGVPSRAVSCTLECRALKGVTPRTREPPSETRPERLAPNRTSHLQVSLSKVLTDSFRPWSRARWPARTPWPCSERSPSPCTTRTARGGRP